MREFIVEIKDHNIKGEQLLIKAFKNLPDGRYRNELYSLNKRSLNQNAYQHVVFTLAQKGLYDQGYGEVKTMEDAKWFYKKLFLKKQAVNEQTGELYEVIRRTRDLSKDEMANFIQSVIDHQLEWCGVVIPSADEYKQQHSKWDLVGLSS